MLIRFRIENYRSLRNEQELSFVASGLKDPLIPPVRRPNLRHDILQVAAIYGANASGKTSILRALSFFVNVVQNSHRVWKPDSPIPVEPFLLDGAKQVRPSSFEIDFLLDKVRYQFGFSLTARQVVKEWLYSFPSGRRQIWYERGGEAKERIRFGKKLSGGNRTIETITRSNSLFLSAAAQNNHEMLLPIFTWLTKSIQFEFGARSSFTPGLARACAANRKLNKKLSDLLSTADLGVIGLDIQKEPVNEDMREATKVFFQSIAKAIESPSIEMPDIPKEMPKVLLRHRGGAPSGVALSNEAESAGTAAYLALLTSVLEVMESGGVLCIDELDSSLHPLLALELVRFFKDPKRNTSSAQLIFNTHDVNLLDSAILRRDEIWFTEKDDEGATHLYSLSDFKPRRNENLRRGYLQGRYGAVPFLGSLGLNGDSQ
jgi:AAA15 family ATPase/GTPase